MRREKLLDGVAEAKLMPFLRQPLKDILVIVRDTGMRNIFEVCRMRIEHIDWHNRVFFNPKGKTPEARRSVPMSDRVLDLLMTRCAGKTAGWVFPSDRSKTGHLTWINQQFARARAKAGLPKNLVMYCGDMTSAHTHYALREPSRRHENHGTQGCENCHAVSAS